MPARCPAAGSLGDVRGWAGVVTVAAATLIAACSSTVAGKPTAESAESASNSCTPVSSPLSTIESKSITEPRLRIPQPPGWKRNTELDSELIRFVMVNTDLVSDQFAPNAVVTLERVRGTNVPPQHVLDEERKNLVASGGATDLQVRPGTTCGLTSETVAYTLPNQPRVPAHPAQVLIVAGTFGGDTYAVTVTVQTTNPGNPTYQSDSQNILNGFQVVSH